MRPALVSFVLALAVRAAVLLEVPVMPGGDSYARLADPRELLKEAWLPGYQATLAALSLLTGEPDHLRTLTMVQGALACAAAAWCAGVRLGPAAAWWAGLASAVLPTFVFPSVSLHPEPLFWTATFAAFALARTRRR